MGRIGGMSNAEDQCTKIYIDDDERIFQKSEEEPKENKRLFQKSEETEQENE